MFQWRWAEAEQAYQRAIALEPANSYPHMMYALLCTFLGRHDVALQQAGKAVELDPLDPMTNFRLVQSSYYARRYETAVQTGRTAIELSQDFPYTHWYVAWPLAALGLKNEAWTFADEIRLRRCSRLESRLAGTTAGPTDSRETHFRWSSKRTIATPFQAFRPALRGGLFRSGTIPTPLCRR